MVNSYVALTVQIISNKELIYIFKEFQLKMLIFSAIKNDCLSKICLISVAGKIRESGIQFYLYNYGYNTGQSNLSTC